jgi:hypothetical protein
MEKEPKTEVVTAEEILKMKATVSLPPFEGWHPAGTNPEHQHVPFVQTENMMFGEPLDSDNCVVLNGVKFRVVWDQDSIKDLADGADKIEAHFELAN